MMSKDGGWRENMGLQVYGGVREEGRQQRLRSQIFWYDLIKITKT